MGLRCRAVHPRNAAPGLAVEDGMKSDFRAAIVAVDPPIGARRPDNGQDQCASAHDAQATRRARDQGFGLLEVLWHLRPARFDGGHKVHRSETGGTHCPTFSRAEIPGGWRPARRYARQSPNVSFHFSGQPAVSPIFYQAKSMATPLPKAEKHAGQNIRRSEVPSVIPAHTAPRRTRRNHAR